MTHNKWQMAKEMTDKTTSRRWLPALLPLLALGGCVLPPPAQSTHPVPVQTPTQPVQAPAPAQTPAPAPAAAETLRALEQLTEIKEELKKLRNEVEEIEFNAETAKRRQQNFVQDLDRRLLSLERAQRLLLPVQPGQQPGVAGNGNVIAIPGLTPATPGLTPVPTPGAVDGITTDPATPGNADLAIVVPATPQTPGVTPPDEGQTGAVTLPEQQAYEQAFNLLKQSKYQDAIAGFQRLADTWPESQLADDAYYWVSEARYVNREFEAALVGFRIVATRYPDSPRVPEALLKIGYIQYDIGAYQEAAEIFRDILTRFPGHQVAVSAQTRLRRIEQTIQQ